jgi:hypothetical protein
MPSVGDRIEVHSNGAPRSGVVTAVSGDMITVRWDAGGKTSLIPGPGVLSVVAGQRPVPATHSAATGSRTDAAKKATAVKKSGAKMPVAKKSAAVKKSETKKPTSKKVAAIKKSGAKKPTSKKVAAIKKSGAKKPAAKGTSPKRRTGKKRS